MVHAFLSVSQLISWRIMCLLPLPSDIRPIPPQPHSYGKICMGSPGQAILNQSAKANLTNLTYPFPFDPSLIHWALTNLIN